MIGSLFKSLLLLGVLAIGFLWLFQAGLLPAGAYPPLYGILDTLPFASQASEASLEKFEGHWRLSFSPTTPASALSDCPAFASTLAAHDGQFTGHVAIPGYLLAITASTTERGAFSGTFSSDSDAYRGSMGGALSGAAGEGGWKDSFECTGTWTLAKMSPVIDPIQGKILSQTGIVTLKRGGDMLNSLPQQPLYAGDVLQTPESGGATIEVGVGDELVTIPAGSSYTVPDAGGLTTP